MSRFLEALNSGRVLLMDGAMGTELQRAGIREGECYELWNLTYPDRVRAIHQAYADAGAEVLLTNTFQANPAALARHGLQDRLEEIARAALDLARSVAGAGRFTVADIGPFAWGEGSPEAFDRAVCALNTADALLLETRPHHLDVIHAAHACQPAVNPSGVPVLLSFAFRRDPSGTGPCRLEWGFTPEAAAELAHDSGIAALGVNCGRDIGMDEIIEIVRRYRKATDLPLFARPNAGTPQRVGDRWVYPHTPAAMAARLPELLEAGVVMVGGCCGTTPEHIAVFRPVVEAWNARRKVTGEPS
jgi:5-methyltetrahydrofolate--homocysteine methyltransferase